MNVSARTAKVAELQTLLRTHPRLRLELLAAISRLFREHNVALDPEVLSLTTLTLEGVWQGAEEPPPPVPGPPAPARSGVELAYDGVS